MFEVRSVFEAFLLVGLFILVGVSFFSAARKIWREDKKNTQTFDCCSSEEAMFMAAQQAMETGKPVVANYDGKKKKLETKTIE